MIKLQMDGGGLGRLAEGFLEGSTYGNLANSYPRSTQIRTPNQAKSLEILANYFVGRMIIL
jgi:hypothetical protein